MNLFENLQIMKESENKLISEFREFLKSKNAQYIADEIGETSDGIFLIIHDGDWKHEHLYMKNLITEFFENKGIDIIINDEEIGESDQDTYSAKYNVRFNVTPKTYTADVKSLKIAAEAGFGDFDISEPSNFASNGRSYYDTPKDWKEKHEWVSDKLTTVGYKCKGRSSWGSKWTNGNPKEDIELDYWDNFDVIKEIIDCSLPVKILSPEEQRLNRSIKESKLKEGTAYKRIASTTEFDNGYVIFNDWKKMSDEEAEELAKQKSIENPDKIFYVKYDDIMNPCSDIKWKNGKVINESNENNIDLSEYEYISTGTGYNREWSLYRKIVDGKGVWVAKHQETGEVVPINYDQVQGFEPIKLDGIKKLSKDLGDMLLPKRESNDSITFEEIKQQLEPIDTHPHLKIYYDENPFLNSCSVTIEGTLANGKPICFYDSSYLRTQSDIDFIKEQYAKAVEKIEHMHKIGYEGVKDESINTLKESNKSSKVSINDILYRVIWDSEEDNIGKLVSYIVVDIYYNNGDVFIKLKTSDNTITLPLDEDTMWFFIKDKDSAEITAKSTRAKSIYFSPNTALDIFDNYVNAKSVKESYKIEETNHNEILDRDYETGEKIFNEILEYLQSIDQVAMNGNDYNWQPSEFNAKNLNADGEIYLVDDTYLLFYPYINEWSDDEFRIIVQDSADLDIDIKNGIQDIFDKNKSDNWNLIFQD